MARIVPHEIDAAARAALYGEIDFVVVNRLGRVIAIEQKSGPLTQAGRKLVKNYGDSARSVRAQITRNLHHLMTAFGRRYPGRRLDIDHLLYLPDHVLTGPPPAAIDPSRIVAWADAVLQLVHDDGRALWLEDPSQNLYRRPNVALSGLAVLRAPVNHRSPHVVVTLIEMLGLADEPIEAGGVVHGFDPQLPSYTDGNDVASRTSEAVRALLDAGHAPQDIVGLTRARLKVALVANVTATELIEERLR